jgi:hypothetical protein
MVEDVSRDTRERIGHARAHERKIVEEAQSVAGQQVRSYAREAQAHMQSIMDSFAHEVDQLGNPSPSDDPLFDDLTDVPIQRSRNGSRPDAT